jgi:hypothetical protein
MGYKAVQRVMQHSRSKGSARLVLMVIATHADDKSLQCFPGRDLLCRESAMEERNLTYAIKKLESLGELRVNRGNGNGNQSHYQLTFEQSKRVQDLVTDGQKDEPEKGANFGEAAPESAGEKGARFGKKRAQKGAKTGKGRTKKGAKFGDKGCKISSKRVQDLVTKGARFGDTCKEEPSLTINEPSVTVMDGANAPMEISKSRAVELFEEHRNSFGKYEAPYHWKDGDFVQWEALLKRCRKPKPPKTPWTLTEGRFVHALTQYFATPQLSHTFADLCSRFADFFRAAGDRFNKPINSEGEANGNAANGTGDARRERFEQAADRIKASEVI